jgi:hypothetical protein
MRSVTALLITVSIGASLVLGLWLREEGLPDPPSSLDAGVSPAAKAVEGSDRAPNHPSGENKPRDRVSVAPPTAGGEPQDPRPEHGIPSTPEQIAAFEFGYVAPRRERALKSTPHVYEQFLRQVPEATRERLGAAELDLAWQIAVARSEEQARLPEALLEMLKTGKVVAARERDPDPTDRPFMTGNVIWSPPSTSPEPRHTARFSYAIRPSDYPPLTAAWQRRGRLQSEWSAALQEIQSDGK